MNRIICFAVIMLLLILNSCDNDTDQQPVLPGNVAFSFSQSDQNNISGGRHQEESPAFVSYTIKKPDGSIITRKLALTEFNESFVTQPEQLSPGRYTLDQFFILNSSEQSIYASPIAGSELADLVEHPLPLSFDVITDETTSVVPEVLALADHEADDFGYVTLSFNVVEVTAFKIPVIGNEIVTKISYEFVKGNQTIASEADSPGTVININDSRLAHGEWQSKIKVWLGAGECSKTVYSFNGNISFDGAVKQLPHLSNPQWKKFYRQRVSNGHGGLAEIFWPADPRTDFQARIEIVGGQAIRGWADRTYWDDGDVQLCQPVFQEFYGGTIIARLPDAAPCAAGEPVDIDAIIDFHIQSEDFHFTAYFAWTILGDGTVIPDCSIMSANEKNIRNRKN